MLWLSHEQLLFADVRVSDVPAKPRRALRSPWCSRSDTLRTLPALAFFVSVSAAAPDCRARGTCRVYTGILKVAPVEFRAAKSIARCFGRQSILHLAALEMVTQLLVAEMHAWFACCECEFDCERTLDGQPVKLAARHAATVVALDYLTA